MRGSLEAGTRLTQSQIARQLEVSTTPVREALGRLASDGFVHIDSHRGAIVRGVDDDELREIYELRLLLEPLAARKAALQISEQEIESAVHLSRLMEDNSDPVAWSEWNSQFHMIFAKAARAPRLEQILRGLRDSATPYVALSTVSPPGRHLTANADHIELIQACRDRDSDRAAEIEERHLRSTLAALLGTGSSE